MPLRVPRRCMRPAVDSPVLQQPTRVLLSALVLNAQASDISVRPDDTFWRDLSLM